MPQPQAVLLKLLRMICSTRNGCRSDMEALISGPKKGPRGHSKIIPVATLPFATSTSRILQLSNKSFSPPQHVPLHLTERQHPTPHGPTTQSLPVALKQMRGGPEDDDRLAGIIKEAYVWMGLKHRNILRFLGILNDNNEMHLVSPLAPHGSLRKYIDAHQDANRPMFLGHIADGISYLHERGVVHGDIKGTNVLVFDGPIAKVCDFGLSKHVHGIQSTRQEGSLYWMSPERLRGESPRSYKSDVYAFGITIYEILSGRNPFSSYTVAQLHKAVCERGERPQMLPESSGSGISYSLLWRLAQQCWQEDPEKRPLMRQVRSFFARATTSLGDREGPDRTLSASFSKALVHNQSRVDGRHISVVHNSRREEFISGAEMSSDIRLNQLAWHSKRDDALEQHPTSREYSGSINHYIPRPSPLDSLGGTPPENMWRVDSMLRAKSASHRSARASPSSPCLEGTRTAILETLYTWARSTDPSTPRVFWLNGMAGTGKSTIAQTLAEYAEREGILGASFFFSCHGDTEVRNGSLVIPTIAFQLAHCVPSFKAQLASALERDPDAAHHTRQLQRQTLLDGPLDAIRRKEPIVVVLDALDECEGGDAVEVLETLLQMMAQAATPPALKLFIASRPDRDLDAVFEQAQRHQKFILHDVDQDVVQADIERYLRNGLTNPPPAPLHPNWISNAELMALVRRAGKLFVYATTTLQFIRDGGLRSPQEQLQSVMASKHGAGENGIASLDDLYMQVLRSAVIRRNSKQSDQVMLEMTDCIRSILGTLVLLRTPLPLRAIETLIHTSSHRTTIVLQNLRSVIVFPQAIDDPPSFLHQSFPDFIVSLDRCPDHRFHINIPEHERRLAVHCLRVMSTLLKRDLMGSDPQNQTQRGGAVKGGIVTRSEVPLELTYACSHWASHLAEAPHGDPDVLRHLEEFSTRCLMWWLEALSWTGQVAQAAQAADAASKWAMKSKASAKTIALLHDVHRFVLANLLCLSKDPHHVYFSALPFVPRNTSLWKSYQHETEDSIQVAFGVQEDWLPCLGVLVGHSERVAAAIFSPDGSHIASGSNDRTVRIWDAVSGQPVATLEGHSKPVETIAFSPDGSRIASGSADHTVRIWDATSKHSIVTLRGHSQGVNAVAFSPDGRRIVSGSGDSTVRTWDVVSGQTIAILRGHEGAVKVVAFSPCGSQIASGADDGNVWMWKGTSGKRAPRMWSPAKPITTITFSPNGSRLASGSLDCTVCIWDTISLRLIRVMQGYRKAVNTVSFFPHEPYIASGSADHIMRIWDADAGEHLSTLQGHSEPVHTIAFSPDCSRIASSSNDHTIRVWNAMNDQPIAILQGHSDRVSHITFSPNGGRIVSACDDGTVRLWDALAGESVSTSRGNSPQVWTIAFSLDGTRVASWSSDEIVRIWNTASNECIASLEGYSDVVSKIAFSDDRRRVATGTGQIIRIWDTVRCDCIGVIENLDIEFRDFAFSPDGSRVAADSDDGILCVCDAESGEELIMLRGDSDPSWTDNIAFSPNGNLIASSSSDYDVCLWDAHSGALIGTCMGHSNGIEKITFSRDSSCVLGKYKDGTVIALDTTRGISSVKGTYDDYLTLTFGMGRSSDGMGLITLQEWIHHLKTPFQGEFDSTILSAAVSPDGLRAAVGCTNGGFFILNAPRRYWLFPLF